MIRFSLLKRIMPTNLFARTLLILLLPVILLQLTVAHVFYDRHWSSVVRGISSSAASDIDVLLREYDRVRAEDTPEAALQHVEQIGFSMDIRVADARTNTVIVSEQGLETFPDFYHALESRVATPFMIQPSRQDNTILVYVAMDDRMLEFALPAKRVASPTTYIFIFWMLGSATLLMLIAGLFLRNQIRPIVQLARAAEQFGLGQDVLNFSPRGASEIRLAGQAFLKMAERVRRAIASRTEMLAGISHDLRTPLTRMQLEIEMGKIDDATRMALITDIDEMRRMIDEYLDFARGDAGEPMEPVNVTAMARLLVKQYTRQGHAVEMVKSEATTLMVRPQAMRRALSNLIDNALRYGRSAQVRVAQTATHVEIRITDTGPGIPDAEQETVFKPFTRLEPSRNASTGGVGLGLSIARDIAQSHGGNIHLKNIRNTAGVVVGLEVMVRLPREIQPVAG